MRALVAEHGAALRADLGHVHRQIELFDDAIVEFAKLGREAVGMCMRLIREDLGQRHQPCAHRHGVAVERPQV